VLAIDLAGLRDAGPAVVARTLIGHGVCASVTPLTSHTGDQYADRALDLRVATEPLDEVLVLVSGLGVHTLTEG